MGRNMESLGPKRWRELGLKKQRTNGVVYGSDHPFGFAVLLRCMRAREPKGNSMFSEVLMKPGIVILSSVITLENFDHCFMLSFDKVGEVNEL